MSAPSRETFIAAAGSTRGGSGPWFWLLLPAVACCVALSNQSLWIDEALSAVKAREPTLAAWWGRMVSEKQSDLQMPFYMFYLWAYEKVFGSQEWILRAANLPWLMAGAAVFVRAAGRRHPVAALALATCPFAWYYANEARPYAMQLGGSLMIAGALLPDADEKSCSVEGRWRAMALAVGLVILSGSSLIGMIWAAAVLVAAFAGAGSRGVPVWVGQFRRGWVLMSAILLALGVYYLWTLKAGARASAAATTSWANLGFSVYELAGFTGLGPGRLQIREHGWIAFRPFAGWLAAYSALLVLVLAGAFWGSGRHQSKRWLLVAAAAALPAILVAAAGFTMHFRVLGRHLTPLAAVLVWLIALGLRALWSSDRIWRRGIAVGFLVLSFVSCLMLRFGSRHARDDYRQAAALARAASQQEKTVWWNASREGAEYYRVKLADSPGDEKSAVWLMNPSRVDLDTRLKPDLVVVSKPDIYDAGGAVAGYLADQGYRKSKVLSAFSIWEQNRN